MTNGAVGGGTIQAGGAAGNSFFEIAGNVYGNQRFAEQLRRANPGVTIIRPGMILNLPRLQTRTAAGQRIEPVVSFDFMVSAVREAQTFGLDPGDVQGLAAQIRAAGNISEDIRSNLLAGIGVGALPVSATAENFRRRQAVGGPGPTRFPGFPGIGVPAAADFPVPALAGREQALEAAAIQEPSLQERLLTAGAEPFTAPLTPEQREEFGITTPAPFLEELAQPPGTPFGIGTIGLDPLQVAQQFAASPVTQAAQAQRGVPAAGELTPEEEALRGQFGEAAAAFEQQITADTREIEFAFATAQSSGGGFPPGTSFGQVAIQRAGIPDGAMIDNGFVRSDGRWVERTPQEDPFALDFGAASNVVFDPSLLRFLTPREAGVAPRSVRPVNIRRTTRSGAQGFQRQQYNWRVTFG